MNKEESVQIFLSRVQVVVNQIWVYGENISEQTMVAKVLRSLTTKFDHVVAAIEESKDLTTYTFDELMGSLQTHESRLSPMMNPRRRSSATTAASLGTINSSVMNSRRASSATIAASTGTTKQSVTRSKEMKLRPIMQKRMMRNQPSLLLAVRLTRLMQSNIWFLDSGCSNHITEFKQLFEDLD